MLWSIIYQNLWSLIGGISVPIGSIFGEHIVLANYEATNDNELTVKAGDIVKVIVKEDSGILVQQLPFSVRYTSAYTCARTKDNITIELYNYTHGVKCCIICDCVYHLVYLNMHHYSNRLVPREYKQACSR